MKKFGILVIALLTLCAFTISASAGVIDDKCAKCHKGDKSLDKIAAKKGIMDGDTLLKAIRGGSKAALHKAQTDADLKAAGDELSKSGKPTSTAPVKTKKKSPEGC
jgi:hypothetical protein